MTQSYIDELVSLGFADEAKIVADVAFTADGKTEVGALCVNGDIVTLAVGAPPVKRFSDSFDRLKNIRVKSGLFKKALWFEYNGMEYSVSVKGGKTLVDYFKLLTEE